MKQIIALAGIAITKEAGSEIICICPECGAARLSVNAQTGQWRCFHGCGDGNAYTLLRDYAGMSNKDIVKSLKDAGLGGDFQPSPKYTNDAKRKPALDRDNIVPLSDTDINRLCKSKGLKKEWISHLQAYLLKNADIAIIPGFDPSDTKKACGWIRVHLDGELIDTAAGPQKYPVVAGSQPGLVGLNTIQPSDTIIFCEGWKDLLAARSQGYASLTNTQGVATWRESWGPLLKGKTVIVIFDMDAAGIKQSSPRQKATDNPTVIEHISKYAKETKFVRLPFEYKETGGNDLFDYVSGGGQIKDLEQQDFFEKTQTVVLPDMLPDTVAREYEKQSKYKHRYHPNDGWSMFKNGQYQEIDGEKQLARYVSAFMGQCVYAQGKQIKRVPISRQNINNVLQQVSFLPDVYLLPSQEAPCWLDKSKEGRRVIPLQNGLLDWTGQPFKLLDHTPDYYTRNYLPFDWNGDIHSDKWDSFIAEVSQNDEEVMTLLQQWAGYCLMKHDHRQQKFMLICGEAGTGKSVFANVLTHLVGLNNVSTIPLELFSEPHMITQAYGKMLNISDESEECILDPSVENALKHYTGGTMFPFKKLYMAPFSAYPTAKVMITTNHLPKFKDSSDGVWRRMLLVWFNRVFKESEQIKGLDQLIIDTEMPGVLAWALRGAMMLLEDGLFVEPASSLQAIEDYKNEMHPERMFLVEHFEMALDAKCNCKAMRRAYETFCKDNNFGVKNSTNFGKMLDKTFPDVYRERAMRGGERDYYYINLRVKMESEYFETVEGLI